MQYKVYDKEYTLRYRELVEQYNKFVTMSDDEFLSNLPQAAHLACIVGYLKEFDLNESISDEGIIHQIIHLMECPSGYTEGSSVKPIRELFKAKLFIK